MACREGFVHISIIQKESCVDWKLVTWSDGDYLALDCGFDIESFKVGYVRPTLDSVDNMRACGVVVCMGRKKTTGEMCFKMLYEGRRQGNV